MLMGISKMVEIDHLFVRIAQQIEGQFHLLGNGS